MCRKTFLEEALLHAGYDAADTVSQAPEPHCTAFMQSAQALGVQKGNQSRPWGPSWELADAVDDLFNQPNIDVAADVNTVAPLFNAEPGRDHEADLSQGVTGRRSPPARRRGSA